MMQGTYVTSDSPIPQSFTTPRTEPQSAPPTPAHGQWDPPLEIMPLIDAKQDGIVPSICDLLLLMDLKTQDTTSNMSICYIPSKSMGSMTAWTWNHTTPILVSFRRLVTGTVVLVGIAPSFFSDSVTSK